MSTPRIFFSYASEDKFWVEGFQKSVGFANVGLVRVLDYAAEEVGYGDLGKKLNEQIDGSAVVVAFVSANYCKKKWTVAEWEKALTEVQRRRLVFVPLMLDADAVTWWQDLRKRGRLTALSRDYAYVSFFDAAGRPLDIRPEDTKVNGKIARLAQQIRQDLEIPQVDAETTLPSSIPNACPKAVEGLDVVILGHPTVALPQEMAEPLRKLCEELKDRAVRMELWRDGWRKKPDARGRAAVAGNTIFVQPIAEAEAADVADNPGVFATYLDSAACHNAKVALWLPCDFTDRNFEMAAQGAGDPSAFPALRVDSAEGLADWLQGFKAAEASGDETRIQIKTVGLMGDGGPEQLIAPTNIIDQLKTEIVNIAWKFVDNPHPTPPPWEFWGEQFSEHLKRLRGNRTIIAIHDLDIAPGPDSSIEKQLQARFDEILEAVEEEQRERALAKKPPLNAFLVALLVRTATAFPFNEYPYDGRYGQWRLLGFAPPNGAEAGAPIKANPDSLAVFRQKLYSWAHSQAQTLQ
jgi:TIR domain